MTSHPSFEALIFNDDPLSEAEQSRLAEHIAECTICAELSRGWQSLAQELLAATPAAPTEGFSNRWKVRLAEDDLARGNRQVWWILGGLITAAVLVLFLIAGALVSSPIQLAGDLMKTLSLVGLQIQLYTKVAVELIERLPGPMPAIWVAASATALAAALGGLTVIWVAAWIRLSIQEIPLMEGGNS